MKNVTEHWIIIEFLNIIYLKVADVFTLYITVHAPELQIKSLIGSFVINQGEIPILLEIASSRDPPYLKIALF